MKTLIQLSSNNAYDFWLPINNWQLFISIRRRISGTDYLTSKYINKRYIEKVIALIKKTQNLETNIYGTTNLLINLRNLWLDLAIWTRSYMVSIMSGFGNANAVGERLYRIPIDFYGRLQMIFGSQRVQGFVNLLSQHIVLMMNATAAMKNRDSDALNRNTQLLYQNSNELAGNDCIGVGRF